VRHYAGVVEYRYQGFVEKNQDSLYHDLVDCLASSTCTPISLMFGGAGSSSSGSVAGSGSSGSGATAHTPPVVSVGKGRENEGGGTGAMKRRGAVLAPGGTTIGGGGWKRPPSVSLQFKRQVNELVATLEKCKPHYVRCVKVKP
jgi:myosin heavy subunit